MIIDVLVCRPDGTQAFEQREVPEDWFGSDAEVNAGEEIVEGKEV